jgi:hypothetical protein
MLTSSSFQYLQIWCTYITTFCIFAYKTTSKVYWYFMTLTFLFWIMGKQQYRAPDCHLQSTSFPAEDEQPLIRIRSAVKHVQHLPVAEHVAVNLYVRSNSTANRPWYRSQDIFQTRPHSVFLIFPMINFLHIDPTYKTHFKAVNNSGTSNVSDPDDDIRVWPTKLIFFWISSIV